MTTAKKKLKRWKKHPYNIYLYYKSLKCVNTRTLTLTYAKREREFVCVSCTQMLSKLFLWGIIFVVHFENFIVHVIRAKYFEYNTEKVNKEKKYRKDYIQNSRVHML